MGLRDTLRTWLTPQERASWPPALPAVDNYWPFVNFGGSTYPIPLQQTLLGPVESVGGDFVGLTAGGYQGNGVVFACLNARMNLFTEARFQFRRLRSGRPGELFGSDALRLLERPWPNGTTGDLLARMIQDVDLGGNAFIARRAGKLARLRPDWVTIIHGSQIRTESPWDPDAEVIGYGYQPGGPASGRDPMYFLREEVAHFAPLPDPLAPARGMSWLIPLVREIEADTAATTHKLMFFRNGATPNLVVTGLTAQSPQAFDELVARFSNKNEGVRNAYKTLFLTAGADAKVVGADLRQIDFKVTQGAGETRIAAAAGVPPVVVGLSEGLQGSSLNAGNFSQAMRRFADVTMRPLWRNVAGSLSAIVAVPGGAELWYDDRDIPALKDDIKDAAEVQALNASAIRQLVDAGFEPTTVVDAVNAGDLKRLSHTGLYSVQLQPPMPEGPEPEPEAEEPDEEPDDE